MAAMAEMTEAERNAAEVECRHAAEQALRRGDWHEACLWAKSWILRGGARRIEPWLFYVASALQQGRPKTAVNSCDLGLRTWCEDEPSRAILRFVRGEVIRHRLNDPKTAINDLDAAARACPDWLAQDRKHARTACAGEGREKQETHAERWPRAGL